MRINISRAQPGGLIAGRSRILNLGMLIVGFGFGQGSIFLAQSWLVFRGQLELLALFGTHFAFAMFGIIIVEAGSLTILARHAASMRHGEEGATTMWLSFWEMSAFRMLLAALVIAAAVIFSVYGASSPFSRSYALCAAPAFIFWTLNAAGFLDGLKLSGISGISGSIAYIASGGALIMADGLHPQSAGILLGSAFSVGYFLTVLVQFAALHAVGWRVRFVRPSAAGVLATGRDGLALLGGNLPGQLYFRAQLMMSAAWLGPAPTALFIYAKQIIVAIAQLINFIRRVEFPTLVNALAKSDSDPLGTILRVQKNGTRLAVAATLCLLFAGLMLVIAGGPLLAELGGYLAVFSISITTSAVSLALSQGLAALGRYTVLFARSMLGTLLGLASSVALAKELGIYGFAMADIFAAIFSILAIFISLQYRGKK